DALLFVAPVYFILKNFHPPAENIRDRRRIPAPAEPRLQGLQLVSNELLEPARRFPRILPHQNGLADPMIEGQLSQLVMENLEKVLISGSVRRSQDVRVAHPIDRLQP